jgi:hypothetical protein
MRAEEVANRWRLILASKKVGEKGRKLHHLGVFIDRGEREGERMQAVCQRRCPGG